MPSPFESHLHASQTASDFFFALLTAILHCGSALSSLVVEGNGGSLFQAGAFALAATSLLIAGLIVVQRATYQRQRKYWLAAAKACRFLTQLISPQQQQSALMPGVLVPQDGPPPSLLHQCGLVCEGGIVLLLSALGWQLPLRTHLWLQAAGLATMLAAVPQQCAARCASPAYQAAYERWAAWLSAACGRAFPVSIATRRDQLPAQACIAVHSWALVALGWVLPTIYITHAQYRLRQEYLHARGRAPSGGVHLHAWVHLGMALLALPLTWRAVEVALALPSHVSRAWMALGLQA